MRVNLQNPLESVVSVSEVDGKAVVDLRLQPGDSIEVATPRAPLDMKVLPWVMLPLMRRIYASVRVSATEIVVTMFREKLRADRLGFSPSHHASSSIGVHDKSAGDNADNLSGLLSAGMLPCREFAHERVALRRAEADLDVGAVIGLTPKALQRLDVGARIRMAWAREAGIGFANEMQSGGAR